jgi:uncharacterized membrane protein HdeD (DUF308 family)
MSVVFRADFTPDAFRRTWGTLLAFGIVQIVAGALAIAIPAVASLLATAVFGWMLIFSGVFQFVHAYRLRTWSGFLLHLLSAALYTIGGAIVLLNPFPGAIALTFILATILIAEGIVRSVLGARLRPNEGWGWFLVGGLASIVLGGVLLAGWPDTAVWTLGLLLGVNLVFSGAMNIGLALACRTKMRDAPNRRPGAADARVDDSGIDDESSVSRSGHRR